jgi:myo-inositol-1(or 4)-monophosphatase
MLRTGLHAERQIDLKSPFDVVSEMDRAVEQFLVTAIRERFPDHGIVAEEGHTVEGTNYTWVLDPLDGTNNYVHGYPYFCVSIGVVVDRQPVLGVIYDPLRDELFTAEQGHGATCNQRPLHVSATTTLAKSLLSTGFPYHFGTQPENNLRQFARLQARTQGIRRPGAAALDLAYVACGRADGHWELVLQPWDLAAGIVLVREAGGSVSDWHGHPANPWTSAIVATNGHIHRELLSELAQA